MRQPRKVTGKELDVIGGSARRTPSFSSLNRTVYTTGRSTVKQQPRSRRDAYLNHISRKSRLSLFPAVSFPCSPRFSFLYPRPLPLLLLLPVQFLLFRSHLSTLFLASLRSSRSQPASFFDPRSFEGRGRRREQFARIRRKKLVPPVAVLALLLVSRSRFRRIRLSLVSSSSRSTNLISPPPIDAERERERERERSRANPAAFPRLSASAARQCEPSGENYSLLVMNGGTFFLGLDSNATLCERRS